MKNSIIQIKKFVKNHDVEIVFVAGIAVGVVLMYRFGWKTSNLSGQYIDIIPSELLELATPGAEKLIDSSAGLLLLKHIAAE